MIPTVHVDRGHRGRGGYALTDTGSGHLWGFCAEVEGLFREALRGTYELFGWGSRPLEWCINGHSVISYLRLCGPTLFVGWTV
ncbi:hypothetical protein ACWD7F_36875, partial [Streptomyces sp. NPDC005122]